SSGYVPRRWAPTFRGSAARESRTLLRDRGELRVTTEEQRLHDARDHNVPWRKWGPYLSERQWGPCSEHEPQRQLDDPRRTVGHHRPERVVDLIASRVEPRHVVHRLPRRVVEEVVELRAKLHFTCADKLD